MNRPYFVGVAGGTASGKSYFCKKVVSHAPAGTVSVLLLDYYYRPQTHRSLEERARLNFDHPDAFEFELLFSHLDQLRRGERVETPTYDFSQHDRTGARVRIEPTPIIIVEGILVLHPEEVRTRVDLGVFIDTPDEIRFSRRLERDVRERGRSPESVHEQWETTVHPMHSQFCAPTRAHADLVVNGTLLTQDHVESFLTEVEVRRTQR